MSIDGIRAAFNDPNLDGPGQLWTHIHLSVTALAAAAVLGVVTGVVAARSRSRFAAFAVVTVSNLGRTVPTFALMALVVALTTYGRGPALVALTALGIPPVLLNTYAGVRGVDAGVVDAARGMGYTPTGVLTRVELPLALPLIFAGIRISAVQIVATAVLAATVGAGGLGVLILSGLANGDDDILLAGAIPTAVLAIAVGVLLAIAQFILTPKGLRPRLASPMRSATHVAPPSTEEDPPS